MWPFNRKRDRPWYALAFGINEILTKLECNERQVKQIMATEQQLSDAVAKLGTDVNTMQLTVSQQLADLKQQVANGGVSDAIISQIDAIDATVNSVTVPAAAPADAVTE